MYRLTTPTHRFLMTVNPFNWTKFLISYIQHDKIILEKTELDEYNIELTAEGYVLSLKLSQEETALFNPNESAFVQIRCKYDTGDTFASEKLKFKVDDVFNDTII